MKHPIDPKIDCVFKALLGSEENRNLLIHFLNAVLKQDLSEPIVWVDIINPYNDKEFLDDKLSVVDIKARDSQNQLYQVEIQMLMYKNLPARIIYNWTDIYSQQLQSGTEYHKLMPTYSIWLLAENVLKGDNHYAHEYKLRDENGQVLIEHGGILLLELNKFNDKAIENDKQAWLSFFKDAEAFDENTLPDWMDTKEMRQAMSTLKQFSEKERNYHAYQARQNYLREQRTILWESEQNREALIAAMQREAATMQEKEAAIQREAITMQEKEVAIQEKEAAIQRETVTMREKEAAIQREMAALQEIEHLKSLLGK